jgi:hypothetical protein
MASKLFPDIIEEQKRILIKWTLILLALNTVLTLIDPYSTSTDLTGKIITGWEVKRGVLMALTIGLAIISLLLSLVFTLIPYKNLSYGQKYLYFALIIFFVIQCLFCIVEVNNLLFDFRSQ